MESDPDRLKSHAGAFTSSPAKHFPVHLPMPQCRKTFYSKITYAYGFHPVFNFEEEVRLLPVFNLCLLRDYWTTF